MSDLSISTNSMKRVDVVTVNGRIDSSTAPEFDATLKSIYQGNNRHNIVVDLSGINYMSSAGLRAIVAAHRDCKKRGGDVRLAAPSERVDEVLSLAGLDAIFESFPDTTSAVGSF